MLLIKKIKNIIPSKIKIWLKNKVNFILNMLMLRKKHRVKFYDKSRFVNGINIIGDIKAETGLGQSMRILTGVIQKSKIAFSVKQVDTRGGLMCDDTFWTEYISYNTPYNVNLLHISASEWAQNYLSTAYRDLDYHYNIAYWLWELEEFPDKWVPCIDTVDEIWTPSEFISIGLRKRTDKPVITVPYVIDYLSEVKLDRSYFDISDNLFLFLIMYDSISVRERKNPQAAIDAYKRAFGKEDKRVGLIVKINHADEKKDVQKILKSLEGYPNIFLIDRSLSRIEIEALIYLTDVFVSLHRAEGFGLPLAEAMYYETPVISTNWSATTEFMDSNSACLVDYEFVEIKKGIGPYDKGNRWAEANIGKAANYMIRLLEDKEYYNHIKCNGKKTVTRYLNYSRVKGIIQDRLEEINKLERS